MGSFSEPLNRIDIFLHVVNKLKVFTIVETNADSSRKLPALAEKAGQLVTINIAVFFPY